ncbi:hypothetical protein ASC80_05790 [Afipia sp. Root123D2]|uniref:hypothetical protein n=1 Tax=Afipia sp. Root123D2 TaxID=1736436 RepID=UPI0006F38FDD|nr:hypothetical protein [Afipia sp. Root123D2]KQW22852.1 hypothetical protein ASC80_05790 [Afipia sp. Root123D2]
MVVAETVAGLGAIRTAFDLAKTIKDLDDRTRRNEAIIDLQQKILTAQEAQAALIKRISELEADLAGMKTWEAEKKRYELRDLRLGFFAYIPKEGMENGEPAHAICANCYQRGFKSILHLNNTLDARDRTWDCSACKAKIRNQRSDMAALIKECRASIS